MTISIIAAFTYKTFGIGFQNKIPWQISHDLINISNITKNHIIVMGYNTYISISKEKFPLENRKNIIITSKYSNDKYKDEIIADTQALKNVFFMTKNNFDNYCYNQTTEEIFIIGGEQLYNEYIKYADIIYITLIEKEFICDKFFPIKDFHMFELINYSNLYFSQSESCNYRFLTYKKSKNFNQENIYLNLLNNILHNGNYRPDRTNTGTISLFGKNLKFNITNNVPLLTTKYVSFKNIIEELLWFIKGETDSKLLEQKGVNIWKANTTKQFLETRKLPYDIGDIGPMYGFNWRHFGTPYNGSNKNYTNLGYDQLNNLIENIKKDPFSRRHMITTFNPMIVNMGVLAPCHGIVTQFYVEKIYNEMFLSCHVYNRSQDMFLGVPYNIASYAFLTYIIAKKCDFKPHILIISMGDSHIYSTHCDAVRMQLNRSPLPFPKLILNDNIKIKNLEDITSDDFELIGYIHYPTISAPMAV